MKRRADAGRRPAAVESEARLLRTVRRLALRACNKRWTVLWSVRSRLRAARCGLRLRPAGSGGAPRRLRPDVAAPAAVLAPAFDLRVDNPVHWPRDADARVAALGPLERLPAGVRADLPVRRRDPLALRRYHHVEDAAAFHPDPVTRAGELARLAAAGVVVRAADADARLGALLGADLLRLLTAEAADLDAGARELRSVALRRAALRDHSSWARNPANLPSVSILLPTRRPALLPQALAAVAAQTFPRLELVLGLHGHERAFRDAARLADELPLPCRIVPVAGSAPLGAVLNAAAAAAGGALLTKMDDDDRYGADHVWDLVLARAYSCAPLVGKGSEFVYLAAADRTVHRYRGQGEAYRDFLHGGAMLMARDDLARVGGWRNVPMGEDLGLTEDVLRAGGAVYRTHGAGHLWIRHGDGHAWNAGDGYFLRIADSVSRGCNAALAGLTDAPAGGRRRSDSCTGR